MDFTDFASAGLLEAINQFGTPYIWNSQTYYGVQADDAATFDLEAGGFLHDDFFSLHCVKTDFGTLPAIGAEITLASTQYRITRIVTSDADPGVEFVCSGINK